MMLVLLIVSALAAIAVVGIVLPSNLPGNPGANLWDQGAQGSDHTAQPGSPVNVLTDPEGVIFADPGVTCTDVLGNLYVKKTARTLATGWCLVTCVSQEIQ